VIDDLGGHLVQLQKQLQDAKKQNKDKTLSQLVHKIEIAERFTGDLIKKKVVDYGRPAYFKKI